MKKKEKERKNEEILKEELDNEEKEKIEKEKIEEEKNDVLNGEEEQVLILKNTIESLNEKIKATQAELINYRKRKDEEVSSMMKYANKDIILELLPILDNFEKALSIKSENSELIKYNEGYKLLYNNLQSVLNKFGVTEIESLNCEFDPNLHEAVMIGQDETKKDDIILEVFAKGYMLKDRVIRPSKVKVNKLN